MKQEIDFPLFGCKGTTNILINQIIIHFLYNCNFGRAVTTMVVFIIENAELAGIGRGLLRGLVSWSG